ncbi:MAG: hypothetical protein R3C11_21785 [Planctomycetaceae bacterium]
MEEKQPSWARFIFVRYKLLFIVYGLGLMLALWEIYKVPDANLGMKQGEYLKHMMEHLDEEDSYYQFQIEKFEGRPEADFLKGMRSFREYSLALKEATELRKEGKDEAADEQEQVSLEHVQEAREHLETAINKGVISNEDIYMFHLQASRF